MAEKKHYGGIGIAEALFLVFLTLKLTDNIDWSWWWVTSPLWIPISLFVVGMGIGLLGILIKEYRK